MPAIIGGTGEPWNVMNALAGHAAAVNNYIETKKQFDENVADVARPKQDEPPPPEVRLNPVSPGTPIIPDPAKYVVVTTARTERRRPPG
jgi:hypothetical protein